MEEGPGAFEVCGTLKELPDYVGPQAGRVVTREEVEHAESAEVGLDGGGLETPDPCHVGDQGYGVVGGEGKGDGVA